jgi:hypothetical protein
MWGDSSHKEECGGEMGEGGESWWSSPGLSQGMRRDSKQ